MNDRSFAKWIIGAGCGAAMVLPGAANAAEVRVTPGDCASAVHLVARDAPLSDVLARLAETLDFKVSFESDSDPLVNVDVSRAPVDLVTQLAPLENISVAQIRDPLCPQREKIAQVWVLPTGTGSALRTATGAPNARVARAAEAKARQAQAGIDLYLGAHGFAPESGAPAQPR